MRQMTGFRGLGRGLAGVAVVAAGLAAAQGQTGVEGTALSTPAVRYLPIPAFDTSSIDPAADPCNDFYKFACGKFAANHPIPADQAAVDEFANLANVNTQALDGILTKAAAGGTGRTPDEQKIGDYYAACLDTAAIEKKDLAPIEPIMKEIDKTGLLTLPALIGRLQRMGVEVFFNFGEMQDFKDSTKQIAAIGQGGLGMPEKDYYLRTGAKDQTLRDQYVAHVTKMLAFGGESAPQALKDARAVMQFETALAKASMGVTEMRDPEKIYHLETISDFEARLPHVSFTSFEDAVHAPRVGEINDMTPAYWPVLIGLMRSTSLETLRAYMRYHLLTAAASDLPKRFDDENFDFYNRILNGQAEQKARWKRCSQQVNRALGEALGQVYVQQYFAGDSKAKMLEMVHDIEMSMSQDIDQLDWMSPATKVKAKEKLAGVANKIGYPDKWRDYTRLEVKRDDALGDEERANEFENDRQLAKIGKPVDHNEWGMTPPTVNAYYDPSMNDINFPAGILQPAFYDPKADDAVNYGHVGVVIGHELTHGFDDEGRKFDATGNMREWWTPEDAKKFETRTDCLVSEYGAFTAVDDVKVNGKLTLGENTADNGGLVLAYMAYLERAKKNKVDLQAKVDGYTSPQRFYIAYAQNWCENTKEEAVRNRVLTNEHSPDHFRANGAVVNSPGFAPAFGCKKGAPMAPVNSCRVW